MSTIRQYAAWAEKQIARLVVSEGLAVGLLGVTQGPMVLTYRVRLLQPAPGSLRKLLSLGPALSQALQSPGVRVSEQPGHIAIEVPSPVKRTPSASELARASKGLSVAVGMDAQRRPVRVNLQGHGALFWIGPSRRGKTQSMKSTLYALAARNGGRVRYVILSQKRSDWQSFEGAAGCLGLVSKPAEALDVLTWASNLLQARAESGHGAGIALVIVADDLLNMLSREPGLSEPLSEISSQGAGLSVHLLAGTQEAGSKRGTGGAGVENNATARILFRTSSATAAARATGQGAEGLQALSGAKGDALLLLDGEPVRIATGLADDREILQLKQSAGRGRPWARVSPVSPVRRDAPHVNSAGAENGDTWGPGANGDQSDSAVTGDGSPVLEGEPVTDEDRALVRRVYAQIGSKNGACRALWGYKNAKTYGWLSTALESEPADAGQPVEDDNGDIEIDLSTSEGIAAVEALQKAGLLPKDTITEVIKPQ